MGGIQNLCGENLHKTSSGKGALMADWHRRYPRCLRLSSLPLDSLVVWPVVGPRFLAGPPNSMADSPALLRVVPMAVYHRSLDPGGRASPVPSDLVASPLTLCVALPLEAHSVRKDRERTSWPLERHRLPVPRSFGRSSTTTTTATTS